MGEHREVLARRGPVKPAPTLAALAVLACTPTAPDEPRKAPVVIEAAPVREPEPEPTPEPAPKPVPKPTHCAPTQLSTGALEYVPHERLDMPTYIDPSGRFGAEDGCGVWELDTGVFLGTFGFERESGACVYWPGEVIPCEQWPTLAKVDVVPFYRDMSPPPPFAKNETIAVTAQGCAGRGFVGLETRFRFACADDGAHAGREYVELSLSPDGRRFVAARTDALELRSLDDGALIAELSLSQPKPPARELRGLGLGWSARGLPVAVSRRGPVCEPELEPDDPECIDESWNEDDYAWELRRWTEPGARPWVTVLNLGDDALAPFYIHELAIDPLGLWLFVEGNDGDAHDIPWGRAQLPLTPEAAARPFDVSGEWDEGEGVNAYTGPWARVGAYPDAVGGWLVGARTVRTWTITDSHYDGEGSGSDELHWASFELTPARVRHGGPQQLASDYNVESHALELLGVAEGQAVVAWSHCFDSDDPTGLGDYDDIGPDNCRGDSPIPPGCEARGMSAELDWLLLACTDGWRLEPLGAAAEALTPVPLAASADGPITAVYGRRGLAVASARRGTTLRLQNGEPRTTLADVRELLPAVLDAELDLAVGRTITDDGEGLALIDLAGARELARVLASALPHPASQLAFSPDAAHLAVSDGRQISIVAVASGAVVRSWDAATVQGLAWRQDGAVLLSGATRALPERAWDPERGVLAASQPDPAFIERLARADLDPSWRWAFEGDEVLLRVLDGLALELSPHGEITQTGLYDSDSPGSLHVRVGGLASSRVVPLSQLPARLRHRGLLDEFLAGASLPPPRLTSVELASLER